MPDKVLNAGFTGNVDANDTPVAKARHAVDRIRDESGLVAAHAVDHPTVTGSAFLAVALAGLAFGYLLGSRARTSDRPWPL